MKYFDFKNGRVINDDFRKYGEIPHTAYFISDPPYNQNYHYKTYRDALVAKEYIGLLGSAFKSKKSVIIHYPESAINILGPVMGHNCEESVSWVYNSNTGKQSRLITWWGCKPDFRKVGQPYKNPNDKRIAARIAAGKTGRLYDWWNINQVKNVSKKNNPHPCPMPLEIMKRIILTTTKTGDLVVDPFGGSGTTALAAISTGRRFLSFETDKLYYDYSVRALSTAENEMLMGDL